MTLLRVLHVTPALFGEDGVFGGAERYVYELARHMAKVVPTTLVSFGKLARKYTTPEGLRVRVLGPAWQVRGNRFNPLHYDIIREIAQANVVHCHQQHIFASSTAAIISRIFGRKVFATDLGGGAWDFSSYLSTDRWFTGHLHISEYSRNIMKHGAWDRAHVIYGGVDIDRFKPDLTIPKESMIVFVGRMMPHKGINDLIEALPDGLRLEIIGRPYHQEYTRELHCLAQGKQVIFRTDCDDNDLIRTYRRAQAVVLPSVYKTMYGNTTSIPELLGQSLLEGMACGIAGICTRVASMPEIVEDGFSGFIAEPNNPADLRQKLLSLLHGPRDASQLGQNARQQVLQKFTWSGVVDRCLQIYQK